MVGCIQKCHKAQALSIPGSITFKDNIKDVHSGTKYASMCRSNTNITRLFFFKIKKKNMNSLTIRARPSVMI